MWSKLGRRRWTRWGFLFLSLLTGLSLLAVGGMSLVFVQGAAGQIQRARSVDLLQAARRALVLSAVEQQGPDLESVLLDLADQGVTSMALLDAQGRTMQSAGQNLAELSWPEPLGPGMRETRDGRRLLVLDRLAGRRGPGLGRGWRHMHRQWRAHWLLLEYEPRLTESLKNQAYLSFGLGLGAAILLWLAVGLLWHLFAKSDRFARQLEEKRRLASLGEMSAVLGHEIRNPLASLKGHAQLLLEKLDAAHPAQDNARRVLDESLRLEKLTLEILDFVRSGQLQREPGDLLSLLREAARQVEPAQVALDLPETLPAWPMDRERLARALGNLLDNAVQAASPDKPVDLSLRVEDEALLIQVRDRGPGLEPGQAESIFEPFVTARVRGTGLGLAIARRIVEGHGGRIQAANHPEGGAVFSVRLPFQQGVAP